MKKTEVITPKLLKTWKPCADGYKRFCELFPKGADLDTAIEGLAADGHDSWGRWLFDRCKEKALFEAITARGYRNAGDRNAGDRNAGNRNAGNWNAGNWNAGNWNAGNWNAGNWNVGAFNTNTPDTIMVFDKPCKRDRWEKAQKPSFLYFDLCIWVDESRMTNEEKIAQPKFHTTGGYLKKQDYKAAFKASYENASDADKALLLKLPNFNADKFFEISGIRVSGAKKSKPRKKAD